MSKRYGFQAICKVRTVAGTKWRVKKKSILQRSVVRRQSNVVCGLIFQRCHGKCQTYFTSLIPTGQAVVRIQNDSACEMIVKLRTCTRLYEQKVGQGQQISVVVPSLLTMKMVCHPSTNGTAGACQGTYDIRWC